MMIEKVEMLHADAGWRPWSFVKVTTDDGVVGWSECTDSHGSPQGMAGVVRDLAPLLIGRDPSALNLLLWQMHSRTRQSPGSIIQKAIGGIENALWDIKAKTLNVPVYELFGGAVRDRIPVYWSHCGTSRVRAWEHVKRPRIQHLEDVRAFGAEVRASGYKAVKTNLGVLGDQPYVYMPGFFKSAGDPALNADRDTLRAIDQWIGALREALGPEIGLAVDLNYNFKTDGFIKVGRLLERYDPLWLEIDTHDPAALRQIKDAVTAPITSCENLYGARQYLPFFSAHAMDTASIDVIWNGFSGAREIAALAALHEMNVSPHNYNGHLSTFISMQLCASVPNVHIGEIDVDDVPWRDELFTRVPEVSNGFLAVPSTPGWGTEVDEAVLLRHPWPK